MSKLYDKHLFFVSKGFNWDDMPEERKYKRVQVNYCKSTLVCWFTRTLDNRQKLIIADMADYPY